jgi:hypothetical protein
MRGETVTGILGLSIFCLGTALAQSGAIPAAGSVEGPLSVGAKFTLLEEQVFGPKALAITGFTAGFHTLLPPGAYPGKWSGGASGFGRFVGDRYARRTAQNTARFAACALLHEDPRYQPSARSSSFGRTMHALLYTFVDRNDAGRRTLAVSNFAGAAASGLVGNLYLTDGVCNSEHAGQRAFTSFGFLAGRNVIGEFAPEIARGLRKAHLAGGRGMPQWWTSK